MLVTVSPQIQPPILLTSTSEHLVAHSAKAGQGMNVSMNDSYNLGWKLAHVLRGLSPPALLHTYSSERQAIAQMLIDFDREMSRMFAAKPRSNASASDKGYVDPAVFQRNFERQGRFMAGVETRYEAGVLTSGDMRFQRLARGYNIGMRFQSVQVLRVADAKPIHLGHVMNADGRWRIIIFGDDTPDCPTSQTSPVWKLCSFLEQKLVPMYTPPESDIDSVFDVRAVFQQSRKTFEITALPSLLLPRKGKLGLQDYEKAFTDEESYGSGFGRIYETRGIDKEKGCVIVVRPDQYVSAVLPLAEEAEGMLEEFFRGVMIPVANRRPNGSM